ncbi:hypothetical protein B4589_005125 [Halolamina sp. CBA1230]|uniref:hypothetical protein n=1 Tax=Halolamina sp. CBA1230 TaxID=1853690 RepID=UPI0009A1774D|nr:hypothetical protein [Halolamina sp. CBA1230]QKY19790.1 hypothetical protein B4589_005125 [Halolamina sp. CBA1230]
MLSTLRNTLFSEPSGRPHALIQFGGAVLFVALYAYGVARGSGSEWLLVIATANVLSGTAESLPSDRRRLAGSLRIAAILVCVGLLALLVFEPGLLFE